MCNMLKKYIEDHYSDMRSLLEKLVSCKSIMDKPEKGAPFGKECSKALYTILYEAKKSGFKTYNANGYYGTVDYIPYENAEIKLGILCHLDVVPEGKGWTFSPFECIEKDGMLYGRGVTDDKGPAVCALYALSAVKACNPDLKYGVRLIFGTNEENGSADIEYYKNNDKMPEMVFTPDANYPIINGEKGMIRTRYNAPIHDERIIKISGGQVFNAVPSEAFAFLKNIDEEEIKKAVDKINSECTFEYKAENDTITVTAKGMSAHASTPGNGKNAISALLSLLAEITNDKTVRIISSLFPEKDIYGSAIGIACHDDISGKLTQVLSLIDAENGKINFSTDVRFPISQSSGKIMDIIKNSVQNTEISVFEYSASEPHYTDSECELVKALSTVYEDHFHKKAECVTIGGGTYVHDINGGVAFGVEYPGKDYRIHSADEYVPISEFIDNSVVFAKAIIEICKE